MEDIVAEKTSVRLEHPNSCGIFIFEAEAVVQTLPAVPIARRDFRHPVWLTFWHQSVPWSLFRFEKPKTFRRYGQTMKDLSLLDVIFPTLSEFCFGF